MKEKKELSVLHIGSEWRSIWANSQTLVEVWSASGRRVKDLVEKEKMSSKLEIYGFGMQRRYFS